MSNRNILVTGGYGCIGSATARWLLNQTDATVVIISRRVSEERSERVFLEADRSRMRFLQADMRDRERLEQILAEQKITHVVHMAALQTPDCNAHRDLGLHINLAGTQNLVEAMKAGGRTIDRYIFASSIAVYGPRAIYPEGRVPMLAEPQPVNVYGAWKLAGEYVSKFFWEDTGVSTLSLRPGILFGPGRDAGLTATPTTAMKCLALGLPFEIPFGSRQDYQYAPDVGAAVGRALLDPFDGYGVFTLPGRTLVTEEIVSTLRDVAEDLGIAKQFHITMGQDQVPFICDLDFDPFLKTFPDVPHTSLKQALRESVVVYQDQVRRGWLTEQDVAR